MIRTGFLQVGSLATKLVFNVSSHPELLAELVGARIKTASTRSADAEITFFQPKGSEWTTPAHLPDDGILLEGPPAAPQIHTETVSAYLALDERPLRIGIAVRQHELPPHLLRVYLTVVFLKMLLLLNRVGFHGAAVKFADQVNVFLGDKGCGKSTVSLALAKAGGTVLGEDHVMVHRSPEAFLVSGCDETSRVTAKTEQFIFAQPLSQEPQDVGGVPKKEFPRREYFRSEPYRDFRADRLFFNRVGPAFRISPLSRREVLLRLIKLTSPPNRFVDAADQARYLDYFSALVQQVDGFDLVLSDDLSQMDRVIEFLEYESSVRNQ